MIISCPNCNKQFKINPSLIPDNGRDVKCGACDHVWFYKIKDNKIEPLPLSEDFADKEIEDEIDNKIEENINESNDVSLQKDIDDKNDKPVKNKIKKNTSDSGKFFSYLVVSIISFVALIILIDTLKVPLINVFPGSEILLFNLFEILKDIKLFIIDLY